MTVTTTFTEIADEPTALTLLAQVLTWQDCQRCANKLQQEFRFKPQRNTSANLGNFDFLWTDTGRIGVVQIPDDFPYSNTAHVLYPFYFIKGDSTSPVARMWTAPEAPDNGNWLEFCTSGSANEGQWRNFGQLEYVENSVGLRGYGDVDLAAVALRDANLAGTSPPAPNWPTTHVQYATVTDYTESRNGVTYLDRHRVFYHDSIYSLGNPADPPNSVIVGGATDTLSNIADGYEILYASPSWSGQLVLKLECSGPDFVCPYKVGDKIVMPTDACLGDASAAEGIIQQIDLKSIRKGSVTVTLGRKFGRQNPFERPDVYNSYTENPRESFYTAYSKGSI